MNESEIGEVKRRARLIREQVVQSLNDNIQALHRRNAAKHELVGGATVKAAADIVCDSIRSYFTDLESFIRTRPPVKSLRHDSDVVDAISDETKVLLEAVERVLIKTANVTQGIVPIDAVRPQISSTLSQTQDLFRSNLRAHQASSYANLRWSTSDKVLFSIELLALVASGVVVGMWIENPEGQYEPVLALTMLAIPIAEAIRRFARRAP